MLRIKHKIEAGILNLDVGITWDKVHIEKELKRTIFNDVFDIPIKNSIPRYRIINNMVTEIKLKVGIQELR